MGCTQTKRPSGQPMSSRFIVVNNPNPVVSKSIVQQQPPEAVPGQSAIHSKLFPSKIANSAKGAVIVNSSNVEDAHIVTGKSQVLAERAPTHSKMKFQPIEIDLPKSKTPRQLPDTDSRFAEESKMVSIKQPPVLNLAGLNLDIGINISQPTPKTSAFDYGRYKAHGAMPIGKPMDFGNTSYSDKTSVDRAISSHRNTAQILAD